MRTDFADLYRQELEHRDRIRGALNIPFALLVILGGLLGQMLRDIWADDNLITWIFWTAGGSGGYFFVRATYYLIRSYHGHGYKGMPTAIERRDFQDKLRNWYTEEGRDITAADVEYSEWLSEQHAKAAHHNWYVNAAKSEFLFRANGALIFCGIFTAVAYIPFAIHGRVVAQPLQAVSIVPVDRTITGRYIQNDRREETSAAAQTAAAATERPSRRPDPEAAEAQGQ